MSPADPKAGQEELHRRLQQFNQRTRRRAAVLTGRGELAKSVDPEHILRELLDNSSSLERLLVRHGASTRSSTRSAASGTRSNASTAPSPEGRGFKAS